MEYGGKNDAMARALRIERAGTWDHVQERRSIFADAKELVNQTRSLRAEERAVEALAAGGRDGIEEFAALNGAVGRHERGPVDQVARDLNRKRLVGAHIHLEMIGPGGCHPE